ncbi:alpha-mannosidase [Luteolibacter yonseiensis]|uniref:Alpha-mannosidase n=1 Tax=Luteolibacter yonseiensis TaxID=1144680 RepID=A0A934R3Q0_9BACT|nr:glycoside hydrolase family 38 C-terminal domain-containing protein [Luteolibacter yonseiensis]MBK1815867.1 alpha-mannosidase [Luteolibacter yonseiensis]
METRQKKETRIEMAEDRFILPLLYQEKIPLEVAMWEADGEPVSHAEAMAQSFTEVREGAAWGKTWGTAWFRFRSQVPAAWSGKTVVAVVDLSFENEEGFGREGQVWMDGRPVIAVSRYRKAIPLFTEAKGGELVDFHVEASGNPVSEWHWDNGVRVDPEARLFRMQEARLAIYDAGVFALLMDFRVCREAMLELPEEGTRRARLLRGLDQACRVMERGDRSWVGKAREILAPLLAAKNGDTVHRITATGHAHIDTAWCWPLRETIRKCARTFSTALAYMEVHPEYRFSCSQPVQYLWMKAHYPTIYQGIRDAVARGQWEAMGSMWVEPDCNVPSGESLVRQLVHGKDFFSREFGVTTGDLWLPDVFGYSAALPQILGKAGVDRFLTQKISWNDTNRFPHHTFLWEGIDGTRIFSHFPPVDTYNARVQGRELARAERQFAQKDRASRSLMPYGYGDGGGGPTVEMIERIKRWENFEGMPAVEFGTVKGFFDAAMADIEDPPVWVGELYLELHRGTYTSQAHNKLMNRRCELLLRDAEFFDAITSVLAPGELVLTDPHPDRTVWDVPGHHPVKETSLTAQVLDRAWKLLLLNQFHDILPGSSIHRVYEESRRDYEVIEKLALAVREAGVERLLSDGPGWTAFNTLAQDRREVVAADDRLSVATVPACGFAGVSDVPPVDWQPVEIVKTGDGWTIANGILKVRVLADGVIASVLDLRENREVLDGPANELHLLRDYPNRWSAWDIEASAMEDYEIVGGGGSGEIVENHPLRGALEFTRPVGGSLVTQRVILTAGSARLDFDTTVDWKERDRVLKVSFPLAIRTDHSVCEIQYGHVRRPVHRNTSWDAARFEIPIQRWIDFTESGYGVALLNNGIFGCDVLGNRLRLTLLKSASAPDPTADIGIHRRTFSLFPHAGDTLQGGVNEAALALNVPLVVAKGSVKGGESGSWISIDKPGVTLEALKRSEDGKALVLRVVEAGGRRTTGGITVNLPGLKLRECDLLENPLPAAPTENPLELRAFDIRSFLVESV